jgi:hypothetical protein
MSGSLRKLKKKNGTEHPVLHFAPGVHVSVAEQRRIVYGGEMTQQAASTFVPLYFYFRLHLEPLGW